MANMSYRVPVFPSRVGIWHLPATIGQPPSLVSEAQLTPGRRTMTSYVLEPGGTVIPAMMQILLPRGTDIRDAKAPLGADTCECPIGSGRYYNVAFVDDIGSNFHNEHRFAIVEGIPTWPVPYPGSRYPSGLTSFPIIAGTSFGVPVVFTRVNVITPFDGVLFIIVAEYNATGIGSVVAMSGPAIGPAVASPVVAGGGNTAIASVFAFPLLAGHYAGTLTQVAGAAAYQWQAVLVTGTNTGLIDVSNAIVGAGAPAIPGPGGQTIPVEAYVAAFAQLTSAGPFAFGGGFTSSALDVTDVIGGAPCTLSAATLPVTALGVYPVNMPLALPLAWTGFDASFT